MSAPWWRRAAVITLAAATAVAMATTDAAARPLPDAGSQSPPESGQHSSPFTVAQPVTVSLITGDQVRVTPVAGSYSIETTPAGDGRNPRFLTEQTPDGVYVFPDDALPAVNSGLLDRDLFNVDYLLNNGYADADTTTMPVIVQYPSQRAGAQIAAAADALPGSKPVFTLESVHSSAVAVSKADAPSFWASIRPRGSTGPTARSLAAGVTRVWLDRKVTAVLDESVPQVGAPQAWAAGLDGTGVTVAVLDSGIDAKHPDFAGTVAGERSFVPGVESAFDGGGHGTHVASTIAGSGAASDGHYRGVAPGARLLNGKVLTDAGRGESSWIIEGMEWAAQHADVVSMSLGSRGRPSDGTDPMSQAVNRLTAQTGALFVIAAGNDGATGVNSPGAADAALTVASVDKSDRMAGTSSRGPRINNGALKPDIAAPGVNIVAARSSGWSIPNPVHVGDFYTTLSGTSMATPHVAGAAAILLQQDPDRTAAQLKAALTSTSHDAGHPAYEQGAGRLDVARATTQQVVAASHNADFGLVQGDNPAPVDRQVGFVNHGDTDVTLTLSAGLRDAGGVLSAPDSVTVPAGGSAAVTVTADAADLAIGEYSGALVGTADGVRVAVPVGLVREPVKHTLTVRTIGRDGQPASPWAQYVIDVSGSQGVVGGSTLVDDGVVTVRVAPGRYSITQLMDWLDEDNRANTMWLSDPEVTVSGDTEITLDGRTASEVTFDTPKPTGVGHQSYTVQFQRRAANGTAYDAYLGTPDATRTWATPTDRVETGAFWFRVHQRLAPAELTMSVTGGRGPTLNPLYSEYDGAGQDEIVHFPSRQRLPVVDVGLGRPQDIAGLDLRGKLALMHVDMAVGLTGGPVCGIRIERMEPIRAAGAAGILAFPTEDTDCPVPLNVAPQPFNPVRPAGIAFASVSTREGLALAAAHAARPVTVQIGGTVSAPYTYALAPYEVGRIPESLHYRFTDDDLARVDLAMQNPLGPDSVWKDLMNAYRIDQDTHFGSATEVDSRHAPTTRTEYVGPVSSDVIFVRSVAVHAPAGILRMSSGPHVFDEPVQVRQRYGTGPRLPGALPVGPKPAALQRDNPDNGFLATTCVICRQADKLYPQLLMVAAASGFVQNDGFNSTPVAEDSRDFTLSLTRDGEPVPADPPILGIIPMFTLPAEDGRYELTADGPTTDVTWTFDSARPTDNGLAAGYRCSHGNLIGIGDQPCRAEPVLFTYVDLGDTVDTANRVAAGRPHEFEVRVGNPQTPTTPEVTEAQLWISTDDGANWVSAPMKRTGNGAYTVKTRYPKLRHTSGAVSLRIEAADAAGNTVSMTSLRAFELR